MILSAVLFALFLGFFVFVVLPRAYGWRRHLSVGIFIVLIAVVFGGTVELMSRPKPVELEWRDMAEANVVGASMREGEAIFVWLEIPGEDEPRAYQLPWDLEAAQELQGAMAEAQASGTGVVMSDASYDSGVDDREPMFYALPQPMLPAKDYGGGMSPEPIIYEPPVTE
jgi:hypothetical protein